MPSTASNMRNFLGLAFRRYTPPTSEEIDGLDLNSIPVETNMNGVTLYVYAFYRREL